MRRVGKRQTGQWTKDCVDVPHQVICMARASICQASS
jgi:hypothetical protein